MLDGVSRGVGGSEVLNSRVTPEIYYYKGDTYRAPPYP